MDIFLAQRFYHLIKDLTTDYTDYTDLTNNEETIADYTD
jgi:hypothetical protein